MLQYYPKPFIYICSLMFVFILFNIIFYQIFYFKFYNLISYEIYNLQFAIFYFNVPSSFRLIWIITLLYFLIIIYTTCYNTAIFITLWYLFCTVLDKLYTHFNSLIDQQNLWTYRNYLLSNTLNKVHPLLVNCPLVLCKLITIVFITLIVINFNYKSNLNAYCCNLLLRIYYISLCLLTPALFFGCWWAQQLSTWEGWWNWDSSEILIILLIIIVGLILHIKLTVKHTWKFVLIIFIANTILLAYYNLNTYYISSSLHLFFSNNFNYPCQLNSIVFNSSFFVIVYLQSIYFKNLRSQLINYKQLVNSIFFSAYIISFFLIAFSDVHYLFNSLILTVGIILLLKNLNIYTYLYKISSHFTYIKYTHFSVVILLIFEFYIKQLDNHLNLTINNNLRILYYSNWTSEFIKIVSNHFILYQNLTDSLLLNFSALTVINLWNFQITDNFSYATIILHLNMFSFLISITFCVSMWLRFLIRNFE